MIEITYEKVMAALALFTAACVAGGWLIKIIQGVKKPSDEVKKNVSGNKSKLEQQEERLDQIDDRLDYLVNANNLVIRSLFTVLGELSENNDISGHIAKAQSEIQNFLTPVK